LRERSSEHRAEFGGDREVTIELEALLGQQRDRRDRAEVEADEVTDGELERDRRVSREAKRRLRRGITATRSRWLESDPG
jgi:hypothetical protein